MSTSNYNLNRNRLGSLLLDIVYPNRCPCCDEYIPYDHYICDDCLEAMAYPEDMLCKYCGFAPENCKCGSGISYDRAFVGYLYEGVARKGIASLKLGTSLNFAKHIGLKLSDSISNNAIKYDLVVPVPMHIRKKLKRGYNQAEVIAKEVAKGLGIPMEAKALKVKYTKEAQHNLSREDRIKHVSNLYYGGGLNLTDKYIVLVDDVITTGSTLNVCSDILHGMGAKSVIVAVATSTQMKHKR